MAIVLTHSDVADLIDRRAVYDAVEQAHADLSTGAAANPAPAVLPIGAGTVLPMAATSVRARSSAVKLLSDMPANREIGLPAQRSTILLASAETGECEALLDGRLITAIRTAATSAVATAHLARDSSTSLGLIGAGALAVEHTRAIARIRPIGKVFVWSRSAATVDRFGQLIDDLDVEVVYAESPRDVVSTADIVCTLTPSLDPIVQGAWFRPGLHLNAVGAPPRADHREIDGAGMGSARLVVDSRATALAKSGDVLMAIGEGHLGAAAVDLELGDVIVDRGLGRRTDQDITLFNSVGIGLQDLVTARLLVDSAAERGVGTVVEMSR
ncbi:ornithine cyclodeaminase family protein [Gordonia insulae]|uniref:Delta(1)-pyrroline-2-carboxylate reductase n=1 Tax=Gordonia insulae TaxID=2420509 RepID=A0A3G8JMX3_9ACTN|nr:ornithine cyclodeaminase family protein [Gordonia insulae]AZG46417.1 Delta(1)-pyrroline-2-carboxylate reductase [Gordonia insulae]